MIGDMLSQMCVECMAMSEVEIIGRFVVPDISDSSGALLTEDQLVECQRCGARMWLQQSKDKAG